MAYCSLALKYYKHLLDKTSFFNYCSSSKYKFSQIYYNQQTCGHRESQTSNYYSYSLISYVIKEKQLDYYVLLINLRTNLLTCLSIKSLTYYFLLAYWSIYFTYQLVLYPYLCMICKRCYIVALH